VIFPVEDVLSTIKDVLRSVSIVTVLLLPALGVTVSSLSTNVATTFGAVCVPVNVFAPRVAPENASFWYGRLFQAVMPSPTLNRTICAGVGDNSMPISPDARMGYLLTTRGHYHVLVEFFPFMLYPSL